MRPYYGLRRTLRWGAAIISGGQDRDVDTDVNPMIQLVLKPLPRLHQPQIKQLLRVPIKWHGIVPTKGVDIKG